MTLVQSWIESLTLLKPKNAQLFIMVTIKSIIEAYKVMIKYWAWVPVLMVASYFVLPQFGVAYGVDVVSRWLYQLLLFATCAATRPSIMKKDCAYFRSQMYAFIYIVIFLFLSPAALWPSSFSPFYIFFVLFFLDSAQRPKNLFVSLWNSLKMIVFNYPLLAIIGLCFGIISVFNTFFIMPLMYQINDPFGVLMFAREILGLLLLPIGVCFYAHIYIKKLHDQFDLYFKQQAQ